MNFLKCFHRCKNENSSAEYDSMEWVPEALVSDDNPDDGLRNITVEKPAVITQLQDGKEYVNFVTHNFLGMIGNKRSIEKSAVEAISKYGVGSCGPRGFYGTVDVHLTLEERLAKFMRTESAIIYSYGFTTVASAIPAYAKKGDVIFADEKVNFGIQRGILASRSQVHYFKHNDAQDLQRLLEECENKSELLQPLARKFLIIEGLYANTGALCPLPDFVRLRKKYKLRIFIDDSISFGVLGETGSGIVEHFRTQVEREEIDMIMGSMEYTLGSGGGFCAGSAFIIEHQRIAGLGYIFSASLPPFLAAAAITAIDILQGESRKRGNSNSLRKLSQNCQLLQKLLLGSHLLQTKLALISDERSPIKHLVLKNTENDEKLSSAQKLKLYREETIFLGKIVDFCKKSNVLIACSEYLIEKELSTPQASLKIAMSSDMNAKHIGKLVKILELSVTQLKYS